MANLHFTDKSLQLESAFGGWALARRAYAEPGAKPNYGPSHNFRITGYDLCLTIDPVAKTLRGSAIIAVDWFPGADGEAIFDFDELTLENAEDGAGEKLSFVAADGKLRLPHREEYRLSWSGSPRRGLYFVGPTPAEPHRDAQAWTQCQDEDAHFVFPCIDHPSVKHPWKVKIVAPPGFDVVGNGRPEGDTFVVDAPMPAYLFSAVVARLDRHADKLALRAGDKLGDLPVNYYVPAGSDAKQVRRAFGKTPQMIEFLSGLYGTYPWARYDQVVVYDFIFGGMENLAATTLVDVVLVDDVAAPDSDLDSLVVHELGHQWWGDLVTCQDWSQSWLNEGWATYTEYLWYAHDRGLDEAKYHLWDNLQLYLGEDGGRYRRPIVSYLFTEPIDMFDRHIYEKGALVVHTLRTVLGEEAFWSGVRTYLSRHANGTVHTRHMQRAFEDASGKNLDGFFAQYVFSSGHPQLSVNTAWADGLLTVVVKQTQSGDGVTEVFNVPLTLLVNGERVVLQLTERERAYAVRCAVEPKWVGIDPGLAILADITVTGAASLLVATLQQDPCIIGRIRAAKALAADGSWRAVDALVAALSADRAWMVRAEVADALAATGCEAALSALLSAVGEADARVRRRIVAALGGFRRDIVGTTLLALRPDPSIHVRGEVARVLGKLRVAGSRAHCEALLDQPSWSEVLRARALEGLGHSRDAGVFPLLSAWTGDDKPMRARAAAVAAMARLGDEVESVRTAVVERLLILAEDASFRVQVSAINALGMLRDGRAMPLLQRVHGLAGDGRARRLAFEAMANIREGRTTEAGIASVRNEVQALLDENRKLRDRVTKLEDRR